MRWAAFGCLLCLAWPLCGNFNIGYSMCRKMHFMLDVQENQYNAQMRRDNVFVIAAVIK